MPQAVNKAKIALLLKDVNHPGRYVGDEIDSVNKDFNKASIKAVLAFPDLYEIGISNTGLKIIYNVINNQSAFLADRVYAPDKDFRNLLIENNIKLYGLETFMPVNKFDIVAFSLQYELNYTTMLGMLELSSIPVFSIDRTEVDPIVIAGGPSCFNPEPFADFVDAIVISDGEDAIIDLMQTLEKLKVLNVSRKDTLKALAQIQGVYVPSLYVVSNDNPRPFPIDDSIPATILKRIADLKPDLHPKKFPIPYVSAVHDRTVVEIRRGCGRMCRFCQPCHVNLPVRERSRQDIKDLCFASLEVTGYDEVSLLSLSTSDYEGLENLAIELNNKLAPEEISISLPSQRADNFNLDLARQLQAVRKSTLTFAPEAGTQRLRDVINKNIEEEHILDAAISAYKAGWHKIKLYFMIGLPTETYEDLDGIIELIKLIKSTANEKRKSDVKHMRPLEITCTMAIFVPKPFTPFQWFGQLNTAEIKERKAYLINAARSIKGVKLNFHDIFASKLECLFSKGDRTLSKFIYNTYKSGAYLDSWTEYFSYNTWVESAIKSEINIEKLTTLSLSDNDPLPWEIIDTGLNKDWLIEQKNLALKHLYSPSCQDYCTNCGVCVNLNVSPKLESKKETNQVNIKNQTKQDYTQRFKYRLKLTKEGNLRYISHLDWFRMIYRAVRRAHLPIAFSQGINPSPKISIGIPLGLFIESISEFMDIELIEKIDEDCIKNSFNKVLPVNCQVLEVKMIEKKADSINKTVKWALYEAIVEDPTSIEIDFETIEQNINSVLSGDSIIITKKTKSKTKDLDIKPFVRSVEVIKNKTNKLSFILSCSPETTIKPDEFLGLFSVSKNWRVKRVKLMDEELQSL